MLTKQPASLGVYISPSVYSFAGILRVALAHDILPFGFNCTGGLHPYSDDLEAEWKADKEALVDQVNRAAALLRGVPTTKTRRASANSSYGLKHRLEQASRFQGAPYGGYICNGAALVACYLVGIPVWPIDPSINPNGLVGISKKHDFPGEGSVS